MSRFELNDTVAIVTGGGGTAHGIGRSIALSFAGMGARVAVVGRHRDALDRVVAEITERGGEAAAILADVTDPMQVERMVAGTLDAFGSVDILVNNVGGISFGKPEEISPHEWTESIALNLNITFFCCAAAARQMIRQQGGKIVNIASSSGIKGEECGALCGGQGCGDQSHQIPGDKLGDTQHQRELRRAGQRGSAGPTGSGHDGRRASETATLAVGGGREAAAIAGEA